MTAIKPLIGRLVQYQAVRYIIVGITGVSFDAFLYTCLLCLGLSLTLSKAISMFGAVVLGYCLNAKWTFQAVPGLSNLGRFCLIYAASIIANVLINSSVANALHGAGPGLVIAFFCATLASIAITYTGLKFWVFK